MLTGLAQSTCIKGLRTGHAEVLWFKAVLFDKDVPDTANGLVQVPGSFPQPLKHVPVVARVSV